MTFHFELHDSPNDWDLAMMQETEVTLDLDLIGLLVIHGSLVWAIQNPLSLPRFHAMCEQIATHIEEQFENAGLSPPEDGWRSVV